MPKRSESLLEKLKLGQQGWNEVLSRNAQRLNDILLKIDGLLDVDITDLTPGDVLWWNATSEKFENVNKAYAISAGSVSSWSSESSNSSNSSGSSESSESSESSTTISSESSSESVESSISSFSISSYSSSQSSVSCEPGWDKLCGAGYTADVGPDAIAYDQSSYYSFSGTDYTFDRCFDGSSSTGWQTASPQNYPEWGEVEFASPKKIVKLRMYADPIYEEGMPTTFELRASNTGQFSGEQEVVLRVEDFTWASGTWYEFVFAAPAQAHKWYRVYRLAGHATYSKMGAIEMFECADEAIFSCSSESSESSYSSDSSVSSVSLLDCSSYGVNIATGYATENYIGDSEYGGAFAKYMAFDGNTGNRWLSGDSALPHWVGVKLDSPATVNKLRMYDWSTSPGAPKHFTLEGSDTGVWGGEETILLTSPTVMWTSTGWKEWTFENVTNYRYYRIHITENRSSSQSNIYEAELMVCDDYSQSSTSSESSYSSLSSYSSSSSESIP